MTKLVETILTSQLGLFILGFLLTVVPMLGIMVITEKSINEHNNNR